MRANIARNGKYPTLIRMVNVDYFPTLTTITDCGGQASQDRRAGRPRRPALLDHP
jgi:hypothetical protein